MTCKVLLFGGDSDMARKFYGRNPEGTVVLEERDCDVRRYDWVLSSIKKHHPQAVINFAGVSYVREFSNPIQRYSSEINVNLVGSFHIAHAAVLCRVRTMVFIASVAGLYGKAEHAGYSASKAGVRSLVQSLGMEKYNAYSISPGRVDTKMREHDYPGEDVKTRLTCAEISGVIEDCLKGKYESGDNIIIRKKGYETLMYVDKGAPWKEYLNVQPIGTPKTI